MYKGSWSYLRAYRSMLRRLELSVAPKINWPDALI
ncbi:TPA: tail fiber assembly protein [Citrobacter freundii]|nr:tail fiber assembly protein [Citrobacter freundii]